MIARIQEQEKKPFKRIVNDLLRYALVGRKTRRRVPAIYSTPTLPSGVCLFPNLDNTAEILAVSEKEDFS